MAKKKFYAVRKGLRTGIYENWQECQAVIDGYSNAEYKSFSTREEAEQYMGVNCCINEGEMPAVSETKVIAYVDGSYEDKLKKYSFPERLSKNPEMGTTLHHWQYATWQEKCLVRCMR